MFLGDRWFIHTMSDSSTGPGTEDETTRRRTNRVQSTVDTSLRPTAKSIPDLNVIAGLYLESLRVGKRPIQALMERFNVDRESAKSWPALCREAGLLPARDQPQLATAPDDETTLRLRIVG
ncbi:MAG: hypothetical protein JWN62_920 [Acidimicrobiales bacterium]|nr:hypothetical protein [Acidimicrobiales bacterium]